MSGVDDRVVGMRFNNSAFERGVRTTLGTLDKLKKSLDFSGSTKSLNDLEGAASRFHMGTMGTTISGISGKLLALGTIGVTAISNITNRAVDAGIQLGKSLTITPILDGYHEYETQLGSIQTILANTGLEGQKGLDTVNAALNKLNHYSDKTIYNFTQMARNIGTFTAAGVDLDTSTSAIQGIANLAALSGSNADQASTAMYQLSQAISNNKVGLQDWNSVVNAGMGGKVFQTALFNMAKMKGTLKGVDAGTTFDEWTKAGNSFRNSLQEGWITGDILTSTLNTFTLAAGNAYSEAQKTALKAQGFNDAQIAELEKQAKVATDAATKVKTLTQLMDTLKEAVGSGWGKTFSTVFGNFTEARDLWTDVSNTVGGMIQRSAKARNKILTDWKALGGRTVLIEAIKKAFADLGDILGPIKKAFRDIFPAQTGQTLYDLTVRFRDFMNTLASNETTMDNIRRTFRGVFAVFDILWQVVKAVAGAFGILFHAIGGGSGGFLNFTGNIGDMLVAFDEALKKGHLLETFFGGIASFLAVPLRALGALKDLIFGLFSGFDTSGADGVSSAVQGMGDAFQGTSQNIQNAWDRIVSGFQSARDRLQPILDKIHEFFSTLGDGIKKAMGTDSFDDILKLFNTVLLGGITLIIKKFLGKGLSVDLGGGVFGSIRQSFEQLTGTLSAMQTQLKAKALLEIGAAVALITASVIGISMLKPKKLMAGVKGLALVFTELLGAMAILTKITASAGIVKVPAMAAAMVIMAGAIALLTLSVKAMAKLDWESLKKGLIGVGVLLGELAGAATLLSLAGGSLARTGAALVAFAIAVKILASAVADFAKLSWGDMLKGLVGVGAALVAISLGMRAMPPGMVLQGAGLLAIGIGLESVAAAVKNFASLKPDDITKGLIGLGLSMATIGGAMRLMPPGMVAQAAALILVGIALGSIGRAIAKMGALNWKTIGKGLTTLAGALAILAIALNTMDASIGGAVALGLTAVAMNVLAGALEHMGSLSWSQIIKGLIAMAAALAVLGIGAELLTPVTPAIAALGIALLAFSAAVALAGAGVYLLGKGLGYLADHGATGISTLLKALDGFIERIPEMLAALANGLVKFVTIIGDNAPHMIGAMGEIISSIANAIIDALPDILRLFVKLIDTFLSAVTQEAPKIIQAGLTLIVQLLEGIAKKIPDVVQAAADVITAFLGSIGDQAPTIISAGLQLVVDVLNGIADGIDDHEADIIEAGAKIGINLVLGIPKGMWQVAKDIWGKISEFFGWIWDNVKSWFGISSPSTLFKYVGQMLIEGIWAGIQGLAGWLWDQVSGWLSDLWGGITDFLGIGSPSKLMAHAGELMVLGMGKGINDHKHKAVEATEDMAKKMKWAFDHHVGGMDVLEPKITPVLDLSNIRKDASQIGGMFGRNNLTTDISLNNVRALSNVGRSAKDGATSKNAPVTKEIKLEQNNYSPKALSAAEIYRQTKNQLVMAKGVLDDDEV